jgi:hypothetical protein
MRQARNITGRQALYVDRIYKIFENSVSDSEFIASINSFRKHDPSSYRALAADEIKRLESQNNRCGNWEKIRVSRDFSAGSIFNSTFEGECFLGLYDGSDISMGQITMKRGIYSSMIVNSVIGDGCLIRDAGIISNYHIGAGSAVFRVNELSASDNCSFGCGIEITIGNETGGREILSYAEMTPAAAEAVLMNRGDTELQERYRLFIYEYFKACSLPFGAAAPGCIITSSGIIRNSYIGSCTVIDGASLIDNCSLLSAPGEITSVSGGAYLKNSCLQQGCEVTSMAVVGNSILMEHSHAERQGKVTGSIVGPDSGVAEGELTASFIGPFTGFHHQSMLISALWPEGRGNIAHGADIGSNHTSRAPDQEIRCGEGIFFGLGCSIKFPADYSAAAYSIIATAAVTLPQKVEFPFSLINRAEHHPEKIPSSYNEIFPGWVLLKNMYAIMRNESKCVSRNKARRSEFDFRIFRPATISMMIKARNYLTGLPVKKDIYTSGEIPGMGKNFMTETSRSEAVETYTFYIHHYLLKGLLEELTRVINMGSDLSRVYKTVPNNDEWAFIQGLLIEENMDSGSHRENLLKLIRSYETVMEQIISSKKKDDIRGRRIIDDYDQVNISAEDDSFIREFAETAKKAIEKIENILKSV